MSTETVGFGRLPNTYIQKINLEDNDTKSFKVVIDLIVIDEISEDNFVWSIDPLFQGFMKIALIETSNVSMIEELSRGSQPHPSSVIGSKNWNDQTTIHTFGYGDLHKSEDEDDKHFKLTTSLIKRNNASELALFTFAYLDHREMSNYLQIKLTGALSRYLGPVASEIIMTNGVLTEISNVFRKPNEDLWAGPVHETANKWYSGATSSSTSIRLMRETVKNSKLSDFRTKTFNNRSSSDYMNSPIISEAYYALSGDANLHGIFSIDLGQFALSKTKLGKSIYGVSKDMFSDAVNLLDLNTIEIRRRQVKYRRQTTRLGSPFYAREDIMSYKIIATKNDLKEINSVEDPFIRTYSFSDLEKSEGDRGEFVYEVVVTVIDNTHRMIDDYASVTSRNLNNLKDAVRRLNHPSNYNAILNGLNPDATVPNDINLYIDDYYKLTSLMKDIGEMDLSRMKEVKKRSFSPSNYKKKFGANFINEYEKLYDNIRRKFGISPKELNETKGLIRVSYPPNIIEINKVFEETMSFSTIAASYDVLGVTDNEELLTLTRKEFESRADQEVARFFDTSKAVSSEDLFKIDAIDSEALRDLGTSKMLFMAPLSVQFEGQKISIEKISNAKVDLLSEKFVMTRAKIEDRKVTSKAKAKTERRPKKVRNRKKKTIKRGMFKKNKFKFNFRPVILKINNITKNKSDYRQSVEYLGSNSEFVNIEVVTDASIPARDTKQAMLRILIANEVSVRRSKTEFDLTRKNNFYEKMKSSKGFSAEKLRKLPLAIKALFNSRSSAARNNIHEAESDILKNVDTKVASEMIFHANQKIEALVGYEKSIAGDVLLSSPIWEEVTEQLLNERSDIICRLLFVENPSGGAMVAPEFKLLVQNSTFIIKGSGLQPALNVGMLDQEISLPEISQIAFSTTNIIRQPEN